MDEIKNELKISNAIQEWIKIKEWTKRQFAEYIGVDESYISQILLGGKRPSFDFLEKVYSKTGLDVGDICSFAVPKNGNGKN